MATDNDVQRLKFGGFNIGAAFFGWLVAIGLQILLVAFFTAIGGAVALSNGLQLRDFGGISVGGVAALLVALGVAYYAGGYVAGRMSRFDGGRQGLGVWGFGIAVAILLALLGAAFGARFNLLQQINLPGIDAFRSITTQGILTLILSLVVTLLAAMAGGKFGVRYHHRVDKAGEVTAPVATTDAPVRNTAQPVMNQTPTRPAATDQPVPQQATRTQPTFGERIDGPNKRS